MERKFASPRASFRMVGRPHDGSGDDESDGDGESGSQSSQQSDDSETVSELTSLLREQMESGDGGVGASTVETVLNRLESAQEEINRLRSQVPGEDAVILEGDEADAFRRYQELGDPDDLEQALQERDEFSDRLETLERREELQEAAEMHGWDSDVLSDIAENRDLDIRVQGTDSEDEEPEAVVVSEEDGEETTERLDEFVESNIPWAKRALDVQDGGENGSGNGSYPAQRKSSEEEPEPDKASESLLKDRYGGDEED